MTDAQRADAPTQPTAHSPQPSLRRRGILAAAGVALVAIVAKQVSQPVTAATGGTQGTPLILGANVATGTANTATQPTMVFNGVSSLGSYFYADAFVAASQGGTAVQGYGYGAGSGVAGYNIGGTLPDTVGVYGSAANGIGVFGISASNSGVGVGVQGKGDQDSTTNDTGFPIGVRGSVKDTGYAVYGRAGNGYGVYGTVTNGIGVSGVSQGGGGVVGTSTSGAGVTGTSSSNSGVIGGTSSNTPGTAGGFFYNTTSSGSAMIGQIFGTTTGAAAFVGAAPANNYAAFFTGTVVIAGDIAVTGAKSAVVKHRDGSDRLVYCEESPDSWFADYGEGTLTGGTANVKLDPDFAALIHTDSYHVFLTEQGGTHHHLSVDQKQATGFTVTADTAIATLKGTHASALNGTFSYRVVGKRADVALERLATFTMPNIKLASAPPALPKSPPPPKKP